jgi:antibiotic biosynthesis monooxygenase (ABM) superfamily enzyme
MLINSLPKDKIPVTKEENDIVDWLFPVEDKVEKENFEEKKKEENAPKEVSKKPSSSSSSSSSSSYWKILIIVVIFYLLNLNLVDCLITKYSGLQNPYIVSLIKTVVLMIILILIALIFKK